MLSKYRDELIACGNCGYEYIVGYSEKKHYENCPSCNAATKDFCSLSVGRNTVALDLGKMIYTTHVDKYSSEYLVPIGKVIASKRNPSLWGIKLALNTEVEIKDNTGKVKVVEKDGIIPIVRNLKIKFNENTIGEIK